MRGAGGGGRGGGTSLIFFFFFLRVKFYFYLPICDYLRVDRKFFEIRREVWRKTLATVWSPSFVHFGATSISIRSKFSSSSDGHVTSKLRVRQGRSFVVINLTEIRVSASASFFVFSSSLPHVFFFFPFLSRIRHIQRRSNRRIRLNLDRATREGEEGRVRDKDREGQRKKEKPSRVLVT